MFFDIGAGELLGLAILAMILVGPERLPKVAVENYSPLLKQLSCSKNCAIFHKLQLPNLKRI